MQAFKDFKDGLSSVKKCHSLRKMIQIPVQPIAQLLIKNLPCWNNGVMNVCSSQGSTEAAKKSGWRRSKRWEVFAPGDLWEKLLFWQFYRVISGNDQSMKKHADHSWEGTHCSLDRARGRPAADSQKTPSPTQGETEAQKHPELEPLDKANNPTKQRLC